MLPFRCYLVLTIVCSSMVTLEAATTRRFNTWRCGTHDVVSVSCRHYSDGRWSVTATSRMKWLLASPTASSTLRLLVNCQYSFVQSAGGPGIFFDDAAFLGTGDLAHARECLGGFVHTYLACEWDSSVLLSSDCTAIIGFLGVDRAVGETVFADFVAALPAFVAARHNVEQVVVSYKGSGCFRFVYGDGCLIGWDFLPVPSEAPADAHSRRLLTMATIVAARSPFTNAQGTCYYPPSSNPPH